MKVIIIILGLIILFLSIPFSYQKESKSADFSESGNIFLKVCTAEDCYNIYPTIIIDNNNYESNVVNIEFGKAFTDGVQFTNNDFSFTMRPIGLFNNNELIASSYPVSVIRNDNKVVYKDAFGKGMNLTYDITTGKQVLTISDRSLIPERQGMLDMKFLLELPENAEILINGKEEDVDTIITKNPIVIKTNNTRFTLPAPDAYDSQGKNINLEYMLKRYDNIILSVRTPFSWLFSNDIEYPVYVDPEFIFNESIGVKDAHVVSGGYSTKNYGVSELIGVRPASSTRRSYLWFNLSTLPLSADITNASFNFYMWQSNDNYKIWAYWINIENFVEGTKDGQQGVGNELTWNNQPCGTLKPAPPAGSEFGNPLVCLTTPNSSIFVYSTNDTVWLKMDVTDIIKYARESQGLENVTFILTSQYDGSSGYGTMKIVSKNGESQGRGDKHPYLNISIETFPKFIRFYPSTPENDTGIRNNTYNAIINITSYNYSDTNIEYVMLNWNNTNINTNITIWGTSLIGMWNFNENQGLVSDDKSIQSNDATLEDVTWTTGKFGSALEFDAMGDNATIPYDSDMLVENLTIEAWVYPTSYTSFINTIIDKISSSFPYLVPNGYKMYTYSGNPTFVVQNESKVTNLLSLKDNDCIIQGSDTIPLSVWTHLAVTYSSSGFARLYVNGTEVANKNCNKKIHYTVSDLKIGYSQSTATDYWWRGKIDEVRIWNYVKTPEEIKASYNMEIFKSNDNFYGIGITSYIINASGLPEDGYRYGASIIYKNDYYYNVTENRTLFIDSISPVITQNQSYSDRIQADGFDINASVYDNLLQYMRGCTIHHRMAYSILEFSNKTGNFNRNTGYCFSNITLSDIQQVRWAKDNNNSSSGNFSILVDDTYVYSSDNSGWLFKRMKNNGTLVLNKSITNKLFGLSQDDNFIYGTNGTFVYKINKSDLISSWSVDIASSIRATDTLEGDDIYIIEPDRVHRINKTIGLVVWSKSGAGNNFNDLRDIAVGNYGVYAVNNSEPSTNSIVKLNKTNGNSIWVRGGYQKPTRIIIDTNPSYFWVGGMHPLNNYVYIVRHNTTTGSYAGAYVYKNMYAQLNTFDVDSTFLYISINGSEEKIVSFNKNINPPKRWNFTSSLLGNVNSLAVDSGGLYLQDNQSVVGRLAKNETYTYQRDDLVETYMQFFDAVWFDVNTSWGNHTIPRMKFLNNSREPLYPNEDQNIVINTTIVGPPEDTVWFEWNNLERNNYKLDPDIVACWSLDENGGMRYDSCGSNDLTEINGVGQDTNNYTEGSAAALFNRSDSDYLFCSNNDCTELNTDSSTTLMCWYRPTNPVSQRVIWHYGWDQYYVENGYAMERVGGDLRCTVWGNGETSTVISDNNIPDNEFSHISCVFNNDTNILKTYLNGTYETNTTHNTLYSSMGDFYLGSTGNTLDGQLDECAVFKRALTDQEICEICRFGLDGKHADRGAQCGNCDYGTSLKNLTDIVSLGNRHYSITVAPPRNFTAHDTVTYQWFANDSGGNITASDLFTFTIINQVPLLPNQSFPILDETVPRNNFTMSWIPSVDFDGEDSVTYYVYINGIFNATTTTTSLRRLFKDGYYSWYVVADDGYDISTTKLELFVVDTSFVTFALNFSYAAANLSINVDGHGTGTYLANDITNQYGCIDLTNVSGLPAFGLVFSGRNFRNITATSTATSTVITMSQNISGNKFLIPITNECVSIQQGYDTIQALGLMTRAFVSFISGNYPVEIVLQYPNLDIVGNIVKSGTFRLIFEKTRNDKSQITIKGA